MESEIHIVVVQAQSEYVAMVLPVGDPGGKAHVDTRPGLYATGHGPDPLAENRAQQRRAVHDEGDVQAAVWQCAGQFAADESAA